MVFTQISTTGRKRGREEVTTASCLYSLTITYEVTKQTENLKLSEQQQFTATHKIFKQRYTESFNDQLYGDKTYWQLLFQPLPTLVMKLILS